MEPAEKRPTSTVVMVALALLAGIVVFGLLTPVHGADTIPLQCFSVVGYQVPCDNGVALTAGATTAAIVGLALWLKDRRRASR